jgi:hypothetical protein
MRLRHLLSALSALSVAAVTATIAACGGEDTPAGPGVLAPRPTCPEWTMAAR